MKESSSWDPALPKDVRHIAIVWDENDVSPKVYPGVGKSKEDALEKARGKYQKEHGA